MSFIPFKKIFVALVTLRWTLLPLPTNDEDLKNTPYQRYGHTAVEYEDCAYIWGGRNDSIGACNTLFRFREGKVYWKLN